MCDTVIDDSDNYTLTMSDARDHTCQGRVRRVRPHETLIYRQCNNLCSLRKNVLPFLHFIDHSTSRIQSDIIEIDNDITNLTNSHLEFT